ncbi:hypothetical protein M3Y98_00964900 [Aphelenchoides besseyi]|nr:hypothetical protein M3Y98_00964900 [Aphelenchoides besseyi]KAI6194723.1 hypothetical protein M3Y96_01154900 [Aphelenchoides besseyi]
MHVIHLWIIVLLGEFAFAKPETAVAKAKEIKPAEVCQDQSFECYLFVPACKDKATVKTMKDECSLTCRHCKSKSNYTMPDKYAALFGYSPYGYQNYDTYCCGCYGGGFIGFIGPQFANYGLVGYGGVLNPIESLLAGVGAGLTQGLASLGALLNQGTLGSFGYGYGDNLYCVDYLPECFLYIPSCYTPLSGQCMSRYCPMTCGFCQPGAIGGPFNGPQIGGYPYNQGGYNNYNNGYYGNQQQYPYGYNNGYQNGYNYYPQQGGVYQQPYGR